MSVNRTEASPLLSQYASQVEVAGDGGDSGVDGAHSGGGGHAEASIPSSIFNLTNTMIGGGTVAMVRGEEGGADGDTIAPADCVVLSGSGFFCVCER